MSQVAGVSKCTHNHSNVYSRPLFYATHQHRDTPPCNLLFDPLPRHKHHTNTITLPLFSSPSKMASQTAVVDDDNNNVAATSEPWRDELEREISEDAADGEPLQIPSILLGLLTTYPGGDAMTAREAARRIDAEYRDVYIPSDPLLRGLEDKGMAGFLGRVYDLVLSVSRLVDCDDARQDALVRFLGELRKLPPTAFKIWGVSRGHCDIQE